MSNEINWNRFSYTKEQLIEAVKTSQSFRQTLLKLGIAGEGGGYKPAKRIISLLNLDTSHWIGQGHLKGKTHSYTPPKDLKDILKENTSTQSYKLGKRLIKESLLKDACSICNIQEWQGQKLSLHLDHINGINDDNRLENLRLLCPNCHSLTETYCGKNKKGFVVQLKKESKYKCIDCGTKVYRTSKRCKSCNSITLRKIGASTES